MPNHLVGAALLRGEWSIAVSLILDPREGDILKHFFAVPQLGFLIFSAQFVKLNLAAYSVMT